MFQCRIVWGLRLWLPKQHRFELLLRMDWSDPQAYSTVNWYPWYIRCWHAFMDFWYVAIGTFFQLWVQDIVTFYLDLFQALLRWCSFHPRRSCARRLAIRSLVDYAPDLPAEAFLQCNDCNVNVCKVPNMLAARSSKASIVFATSLGGNIMCSVSLARYANTCWIFALVWDLIWHDMT